MTLQAEDHIVRRGFTCWQMFKPRVGTCSPIMWRLICSRKNHSSAKQFTVPKYQHSSSMCLSYVVSRTRHRHLSKRARQSNSISIMWKSHTRTSRGLAFCYRRQSRKDIVLSKILETSGRILSATLCSFSSTLFIIH